MTDFEIEKARRAKTPADVPIRGMLKALVEELKDKETKCMVCIWIDEEDGLHYYSAGKLIENKWQIAGLLTAAVDFIFRTGETE